MRLSASPTANHVVARATSGQVLDISYGPAVNALVFVEAGWSADVRGAAAAPSVHRQVLLKEDLSSQALSSQILPTSRRRRVPRLVRRTG